MQHRRGGAVRGSGSIGSLVALLTAHAISQTGNVVTAFAIPFYVIGIGGSGIEVGTAAFFATAPVVLGGMLGGVLVDRLGHRRVSILADLLSGVTVLMIPVLASTVGLPFWALLLLVFVGGLFDTPGQTARRVMLPALSVRAGVHLEQSVGLLDGSERLARLIGASLAGLLVALCGATPALFANAAAFAVSGLLTWRCVAATPVRPRPDVGASRPGYWAELAEGLGFIKRDRLMRLVVGLVLVTNLFDAARGSSLMPLYANDRLGGAAALGLLVAVAAGSALLGNVGFGFIAHRVPRRVFFAVCFMIAGGPLSGAFALGAPLPVLLAASAVSGLASGALNPILGAVELERVPEAMRGRVLGMINAGAWAGVPFGALLGGWAVDAFGLSVAFGAIAVLYSAITLSPLLGGSWRLMERTRAATPGQANAGPAL